MAQTYSFPGPSGLTTTTDGRKDIASLIARDQSGNARAGVFPRHGNALVTARADMKVDVAAFEACAVQFGGPILLTNDGTVQVTLATAPVANSRIDVIYVKQNESAAPGTDADTSKVLASVTGVASTSPAKPAIPTGALELATVLVPAGVVATNAGGVTITQTHLYTTTAGGMLYCRNMTELQAWAPVDGMEAYSAADATAFLRARGAWDVPGFATVASATARDAIFGVPATEPARVALQQSGAQCLRTDLGWSEQYYATYDPSTNPQGAKTAGWYPVPGSGPRLTSKPTASTALSASAIRFGWLTPSTNYPGFAFSVGNGSFTVPWEGMWQLALAVGNAGSAAGANSYFQQGAGVGDVYAAGTGPTVGNPTGSGAGIYALDAGIQLSPYAGTVTGTANIRTERSFLSILWIGVRQV